MGHCLSCFKNDSNAEQTTQDNSKHEVTEVVNSCQVPISTTMGHPQAEPLLSENDNPVYRQPINEIISINHRNHLEHMTESTFKPQPVSEGLTKPLCQKLPLMSALSNSEPRVSDSKINQLFDQYKDSREEAILAEGIESLCNDLQLSPEDFKVLVLAWKLNASQMCRFTKSEFTQGLKGMKTDSIKGIQIKLNEIISELKIGAGQFKDLYRFTFKFGLDVSSGQRILPTDIAVLLWRLVFTSNEPPILDRWLNYLEKNPHVRGIPKDTWYMFLNFCEYVGNDLSSYDDTEAWPGLFDDFVEYENDQVNQNVTKSDMNIQD